MNGPFMSDEFMVAFVTGSVVGYSSAVLTDNGWVGMLWFVAGMAVGFAVLRWWGRRSQRGA